jgi:heme oxygenase (staphylobilin-producing)
MIAIFNSLPVKEGAADRIIERFAASRGHVRNFPGFVSMEVLRPEEQDEVLVITRWQNRVSFEAWVRSEELSPPSALASTVPRLTLTATA